MNSVLGNYEYPSQRGQMVIGNPVVGFIDDMKIM
jgi:hypothetical protein